VYFILSIMTTEDQSILSIITTGDQSTYLDESTTSPVIFRASKYSDNLNRFNVLYIYIYISELKIVLCIIHVVDMVLVRIIYMTNGSVFVSFGGMVHCVTSVS
jgi:hypothetical protein